MGKIVHVAAAVLTRPDHSFLLGQRGPDTFYSGYWEFPGGKVEDGETPAQALVRELREELAIEVETCWPWLVREHVYEHAHVYLHFFTVPRWRGEIRPVVHSALAWQRPGTLDVTPMLPANAPILKALALPRGMAITQAAAVGVDTQLAQLSAALERGLRLVQIREAALPATERIAFAKEALARCRAAGALCLINEDAALAGEIAADGLHLSARSLTATQARPDFNWVGASCHTRAELEAAARLGLDYALLGPLAATPTHPGQPGLGWPAFTALAAELSLPVFALGGVGPADLETAQAAGAHGVAAIRASWSD